MQHLSELLRSALPSLEVLELLNDRSAGFSCEAAIVLASAVEARGLRLVLAQRSALIDADADAVLLAAAMRSVSPPSQDLPALIHFTDI